MRRFYCKDEKKTYKKDTIKKKDIVSLKSDQVVETTKYNKNGVVTTDNKDVCILVMKDTRKNKNIFKVLCSKHGKLFNPLTNNINDKNKDKINMFSYKEVNYKTYINYLSFLKTRNNSNLIIAEREII